LPKTVWSGVLGVSLVQFRVALIPATIDNRIKFREVDPSTNPPTPIQHKKVNAKTGVEVKSIAKGYEYARGEYVIITPEDLQKALPQPSRGIDIIDFVDSHRISPLYFVTPHYIIPATNRDEHAYKIIRDVLVQTQKAGVAEFVMRRGSKKQLALVFPYGDILVLYIMRYHDELRRPGVVQFTTTQSASEQEMQLARSLIASWNGTWNPENYHDAHRAKLWEIIQEKRQHGKVELRPDAPEVKVPSDLMNMLEASLVQIKLAHAERGKKKRMAKAKKTPKKKVRLRT
jgi:DNA end-binding protein Ku